METLNVDVVGFWNKINRFVGEVMLSNSSNVSRTSKFDIGRLKSYLLALRTYLVHITGEPALDLVETNPRVYKLKAAPQTAEIENESLEDACRLLELARDEMVNSQSSRIASGLISFDAERFMAIVTRCENLVKNYIEVATPLDMPKTSPQDPRSEPGLGGI